MSATDFLLKKGVEPAGGGWGGGIGFIESLISAIAPPPRACSLAVKSCESIGPCSRCRPQFSNLENGFVSDPGPRQFNGRTYCQSITVNDL